MKAEALRDHLADIALTALTMREETNNDYKEVIRLGEELESMTVIVMGALCEDFEADIIADQAEAQSEKERGQLP